MTINSESLSLRGGPRYRAIADELAERIAGLPTVEAARFEPARPRSGEPAPSLEAPGDGSQILVDLEPGTDASAAVRLLVESGAEVASVETTRESLEEIFLKLVEEGEAEESIP